MDRKMIKAIVCEHTKNKLDQMGISYERSSTFHCDCNAHVGFFVVPPCSTHTLFKPVFGVGEFVFECKCPRLGPFKYYINCCAVRYTLNFSAEKICLAAPSNEIIKK